MYHFHTVNFHAFPPIFPLHPCHTFFLFLSPHTSLLLSSQKPVVLTDTKLCDTALKWDLDYLAQHMGTERYMVFLSANHKFKYYDEAKIKQYKTNFVPPTRRVDLTFPEFVKKLREWKPGDERYYSFCCALFFTDNTTSTFFHIQTYPFPQI